MEITLVLLLLAAGLWATVILAEHIVKGSTHTSSAGYLLASGALVLIGMNLAFALLFCSLVVIGLVLANAVNVLS